MSRKDLRVQRNPAGYLVTAIEADTCLPKSSRLGRKWRTERRRFVKGANRIARIERERLGLR